MRKTFPALRVYSARVRPVQRSYGRELRCMHRTQTGRPSADPVASLRDIRGYRSSKETTIAKLLDRWRCFSQVAKAHRTHARPSGLEPESPNALAGYRDTGP